MHLGFDEYFTGDNGRDTGFIRDAGSLIEELGYRSLWVGEHIVLPSQGLDQYPHNAAAREMIRGFDGMCDQLSVLTFIAAGTSRLRLGTGVYLLSLRNPVIAAHEIATVDLLSNGRLDLGIGIGWWKEEYAALGVPWTQRGKRFDDYIRAIRVLWTEHESSYQGDFADFTKIRCYPKPIQHPHPPLYIAGNGEVAAKRIASHPGLNWYGSQRSIPEVEAFLELLSEALAGVGRDLGEVRLTIARRTPRDVSNAWELDREYLEQCEALGLDEVVLRPRLDANNSYEEQMRKYAEYIGLKS